MNINPEFSRKLEELMKLWGAKTKSGVIKDAVNRCLEQELRTREGANFVAWLGAGVGTDDNPEPQFKSHKELWE